MSSEPLRIQLQLQRPAFDLSVDLTLPGEGITVLFGPSGSGKTTLLRCVAGLEPAARGYVGVQGQAWLDDGQGVNVPVWQRELGYVFQEASLFEHLDVRGNLGYGLRRRAGARTGASGGEALQHAVDLLGIGHLLDRRVGTLSGGERQRVAIARALARQPRLLLLDEPLAAIDLARRKDVLPWLEKLRDELNLPMLYVTHSADEAARLADHLVLLGEGKVRADGPVAQVLPAIDSSFAAGEDVGTLVMAKVVERDERWGLVRAAFDGGSFWLGDTGIPMGQGVRLRVLARDVSIQLAEPSQTSVQNHLAVRIGAVETAQHPSQAVVKLQCGQQELLARVTRRAVETLPLRPGMQVWALVKAVAVIG